MSSAQLISQCDGGEPSEELQGTAVMSIRGRYVPSPL